MIFLLLVSLAALVAADYQPGEPGGRWSEDDLLKTKAKLRWIMQYPYDALQLVEGGKEIFEFYQTQDHHLTGKRRAAGIIPNQAKIVRLTFHDCLLEDGGAGCNGCMNFEGMGNLFSLAPCYKANNPDACSEVDGGIHPEVGPFKTDNNNLLWVAKVLEAVYKDPNFGPDYMQHFDKSLFESGKSRADLWAFAGLVAVQRGAENNNRECDASKPAPCLGQIDKDSPSCAADLPLLKFKSGRSDCVPSCTGEDDFPFCTSAHEVHPNQHANGEDTVSFFKESFDLTPRETVALMGVHTLGHPMEFNSMFHAYPWTTRSEVLNNFYYINLVNTTSYRIINPKRLTSMKGVNVKKCNLPVSSFIGDEDGNAKRVVYKVRSERRTASNGPFNWQIFTSRCSVEKCKEIQARDGGYSPNSCCHYADECVNGGSACPKRNFICYKDEDCESTRLLQKINMLSPDMGLYYKFEVDETGRPTGCPGMDDEKWLANKYHVSDEVFCEVNDAKASEKETMAEVVEMYAKDNQLWLNDFAVVFEKMLENGVDADSLNEESSNWFPARCNIWTNGKCRIPK